jgi:hypothetical protein
MEARIFVYKDKRGKYRWNASTSEDGKSWNIVCQSTDPKKSPEDAELEGRRLICQAWQVVTGGEENDENEPLKKPGLLRRLARWIFGE